MRSTIVVISENQRYKDLFQDDEYIELCLVFDKPSKEINVDYHAVLIDGDTISYHYLSEIRDLYPSKKVFYKIGDIRNETITRNIHLVCSGHDIQPISEYYTAEQVGKVIKNHLHGQELNSSNRVIAFFGTHSGAGVSTTALNVARVLGERVKENVLVLSLNPWDPSDYFLDYDGGYLNDLKIDLKQMNLTEDRLRHSVYRTKHFSHLAGNRDIKLQRFFTTEEIEHLITVAKKTFDIVLIDAGSHFDNACYAQSFVSSDLKFLITTQDDKGYRNYFPLIYQQLIEPLQQSANTFILLLNQYQANYSLINEKDLQEELEMSLLTSIPSQDMIGSIAMRQKKLLYDMAEADYKKAISTIVNTIHAKARLTGDESIASIEQPKKRFFSLFKKRIQGGENVWQNQ